MSTIAEKVRRLRLSKNQRTLRDAGVLDTNGVHTQEGRNLLWVILFDQYEDSLVKAVGDVKKVEEEECGC